MRVIFSGGGTLGSVTPLIAVAEELRMSDRDAVFLWIGTKDGPERATVARYGIAFRAITSGRLRRFFTLSNLLTPFLVLAGLIEAAVIIRRWRPDVVVSAGGFVAVPVVWAAWLARVPVHIHQMDLRTGLANRLSAPFAKSVSVVFERSKGDFAHGSVKVTGNPVRREILSGDASVARDRFGLEPGVPTLLVLGGGTGAENLNRLTAEAAGTICRRAQILHLTGRDKHIDLPAVLGRYRQVEFLGDDMGHAFAAADLVVTRAGMGTLTELSALGKPAIAVPIKGSHQEENAGYFADRGAVVRFDESRPAGELAELILSLLWDDVRREEMARAAGSVSGADSAAAVADIVFETAGKR